MHAYLGQVSLFFFSSLLLIIFNLLTHTLTLAHAQGPCPTGSFACNNGVQCVPQRQMCDNSSDCSDGSDEHPVECGNLYGSKKVAAKIVDNARKKQQQRQRLKLAASVNSSSGDLSPAAAPTATGPSMPMPCGTYYRCVCLFVACKALD